MVKKISLFISLLVCVKAAFAQNGIISGTITDAKSKEAVIGANVLLEGTGTGASTDVFGNFAISNVKPGTYTLIVSNVAYKSKKIQEVVVSEGKTTSISAEVEEDVAELENIIITGVREKNNDLALLKSMKESQMVVSGISAEQITKLPDRDAAQIMQRVPGVTIVDNKFVMIRGVDDRYNAVMINNVLAPSTKSDKRSFEFDLIPSSIIDQVLIYKSGSPELPGDFAGGTIKVETKNSFDEPFTSFSLGIGYRSNTTFSNFIQSQGSFTDHLGFDNGFRSMPSSFPSTSELQNSSRASALREEAGRSLTNNFGNNKLVATPDYKLNLTLGRNFYIGSKEVNTITSLGYSNSYQYSLVDRYRYFAYDPQVPIQTRFFFQDQKYARDNRVSLIHNWHIKLNGNNRVEWKNMFNQLGENEAVIREGTDFLQRPDQDMKNYAYHYLSRSIYSTQLQGTHHINQEKTTLKWVAGMNYLNRNEPDFRRFRTYRSKTERNTEAPYQMQLPPSANLFETGRFYSRLIDISFSNGGNIEHKIGKRDKLKPVELKAGYYIDYRRRNFNARYISYLYPGYNDPFVGEELIRKPIDQIFAPENISRTNGFVIEEGTRPTDIYTSSNFLTAMYASSIIPLGRFTFSGGVRLEHNIQELASSNDKGPIYVKNPVLSPLPSLNTSYNFTDKSLFRVAYSKTINRPEFREIAPFLYYNFDLEAGVIGYEGLKTADIHNVDMRYEFYPTAGETFSLGVFYKNFINPIESFLRITTESPQFTYRNAVMANSYGAEFELRKSLGSLWSSWFLDNLSVVTNASYIVSRVNMGEAATAQDQIRPLQGQSPYIINTGLFYNDIENGFSANLAYNTFGKRIFAVGDVNFPTIYELQRHSVDLSVSKTIRKTMTGKSLEVKVGIEDLLNYKYRFYQDSNVDGKIGDADDKIFSYRTGTYFTGGITWKL